MSTTAPLASRLSLLKPSATVAVAQRARELRAAGVDVLSLSVGEPDFETPIHIREAAKKAIDGRSSHYTDVTGVAALREAVCLDSRKRRGGVGHEPADVVVSVGAKHSLFNLAFALYDPGDEVIIPAPFWVSYPEQVQLAGAKPVIVTTGVESGFRLKPEQLAAAITPKTKALILCSPSNPTGAAYCKEELRALAAVAARHSFWLIVDEIYGRLVYGGFDQRSMLEVAPELRDRIIIVDGVSKSYAMTGWRIGWMLGPRHVAKACDTIQGQGTTNPTAVAQYAAIAALTGPDGPVEEMRQAFEARRNLIVEGLNSIEGMTCRMPEGAFYAFTSVESWLGRSHAGGTLHDDVDVARFLLDEARVAIVPGSPFGAPGFIRVSYAAAEGTIREALNRIKEAASRLG